MELSKMINLLDRTVTRLSKVGTKNWVEILEDRNRVYASGKKIKF